MSGPCLKRIAGWFQRSAPAASVARSPARARSKRSKPCESGGICVIAATVASVVAARSASSVATGAAPGREVVPTRRHQMQQATGPASVRRPAGRSATGVSAAPAVTDTFSVAVGARSMTLGRAAALQLRGGTAPRPFPQTSPRQVFPLWSGSLGCEECKDIDPGLSIQTRGFMTMDTKSVLDHHLAALMSGETKMVLDDYTEESVLMTVDGTVRGLEALAATFDAFFAGLFAPGTFEFVMDQVDVCGEVAFIAWHAKCTAADIRLGTDTFVVRDGKIGAPLIANHRTRRSADDQLRRIAVVLPGPRRICCSLLSAAVPCLVRWTWSVVRLRSWFDRLGRVGVR